MDTKKPKISIIVPVYNVEKYISHCLDSLVHQTYQNIEIICVNDGTLDRSREIILKYRKQDSRIILVDQINQGLSAARNNGLRYATGQYAMFVDSDDWIETRTCEVAVKEAIKYNADVVIWNYTREIGDVSKPKIVLGTEKIVFTDCELRKLHRRFLGLYREELSHPENANSLDTAWGKLYKMDLIIKNNILFIDTKEIGTEDALFNLYVFGNVKKVVYLPECLNHYRRDNEKSLTKTYKSCLKMQWDELHKRMADYISSHGNLDDFKEALNNRICLSIIGLGLNIVRSDKGFRKIQLLKEIIYSETFKKACIELKLSYFPLHWKVFFFGVKHRFPMYTYLMLYCIRKLKGN